MDYNSHSAQSRSEGWCSSGAGRHRANLQGSSLAPWVSERLQCSPVETLKMETEAREPLTDPCSSGPREDSRTS